MIRSLRLTSIGAVVLVASAIVLRIVDPAGLPGPSVSAIVPILWGLGALVILALTYSWAPTLAWAAVIVGSTVGALAVLGYTDEVRRSAIGVEPRLSILALTAALLPPVIAGTYAALDRRRRLVVATSWAAVGTLTLLLVARAVIRGAGGEIEGLVPERLWLGLIALLACLGLVRDLGPAVARTRQRLAAADPPSGPGAALPALRIFVDELVPGRAAGRAEAIETERGRIAADLHAEVLPSLRRALAAAEAGGTVERLAVDLRTAVDEVETLLIARRSIVLEEMGLLAGIEWLAERTEDRSSVRVEIEVASEPDDARPPGPDPEPRPPRDVERAAFRIAQLALDNVVRHAPGSRVRVGLETRAASLRLRIADDGAGPPIDEATAARSGRRGISDMRAEATGCGGALEIGPRPGGGTAVTFRWPAAGGPVG
jgi:signal transduction histidine kinase